MGSIKSLIICLFIFCLVSACKSDSQTSQDQKQLSPQDISYSGLWIMSTTKETYLVATDERIYTEISVSPIAVQQIDTELVRYNDCKITATSFINGAIGEKYFYLYDFENGFEVVDEVTLVRKRTVTIDSLPNYYYKEVATIHKLSDSTDISQGQVIVTGGDFINENTTDVCVQYYHHVSGVEGTIAVRIPYGSDTLLFEIHYNNPITTGSYPQTYMYDEVEMYIYSNALDSHIGTSSIRIDSGSLSVSEVSEGKLKADFNLIDIDMVTYSGSLDLTY